VLDHVERRLVNLGFEPGTRVKTTQVLIEKLQRESCRLSQVQDLAGARVVVPHLTAQDEAVSLMVEEFNRTGTRQCKIIDRRARPSHGYRAVHVIAYIETIPVEIQVRTKLEDAWAQIFESVADRWGRQMRYGDEPQNPDAAINLGGVEISRRKAVAILMSLSLKATLSESPTLRDQAVEWDAAGQNLRVTGDLLISFSQKPEEALHQENVLETRIRDMLHLIARAAEAGLEP